MTLLNSGWERSFEQTLFSALDGGQEIFTVEDTEDKEALHRVPHNLRPTGPPLQEDVVQQDAGSS